MVGERVAQAGEGSGAPSAHLCRLRHWNLYLGRPTQGLLVSVTRSVKGTDAQGVASGVGPETEEHVAPGAARRLHEAAHTTPGETEAGVGVGHQPAVTAYAKRALAWGLQNVQENPPEQPRSSVQHRCGTTPGSKVTVSDAGRPAPAGPHWSNVC